MTQPGRWVGSGRARRKLVLEGDMRDLREVFVLALLAGGLPPTAWGAPYWVAYEGDVFPEEDGWERDAFDLTGHEPPGAERSLVGGVLTIDSFRSPDFTDSYQITRSLNPAGGEYFLAEWRVSVTDWISPFDQSDVGLAIAPDQEGLLAFEFFPDRVRSTREGWTLDLDGGGFHSFSLISADMETYDLWIDGDYRRSGAWDLFSINRSFFAFGDLVYGGDTRSISQWDYVRFGVVPEPSSLVAGVLVVGVALTWKRSSR